jgi:hypothetical protein
LNRKLGDHDRYDYLKVKEGLSYFRCNRVDWCCPSHCVSETACFRLKVKDGKHTNLFGPLEISILYHWRGTEGRIFFPPFRQNTKGDSAYDKLLYNKANPVCDTFLYGETDPIFDTLLYNKTGRLRQVIL